MKPAIGSGGRGGPALAGLAPQPADALLALIGLHRRDPRPEKIDLGVGVYRDAAGATPVLRAVKAAEAQLLREQHSKSYLGAEGDVRFVELLAPIVFGRERHDDVDRIGVQTPGGTGALRLGAELIARASPAARVWIGDPSWPNHAPIFTRAGLQVRLHRYFDRPTATLDFEGMMAALEDAAEGDVVLIHGCCHNPTGTGFSAAQWRQLIEHVVARGLLPFVDLAYQGLGEGLDADAMGVRMLLRAVPEALAAYSCDKNFGLYRDRVGALWVQGRPADLDRISGNMLALARSLWSMPPDHGAAVVRLLLESDQLGAQWRAELEEMRLRINALRAALAAAHPQLAPIGRQRGMFAMLPLDRASVAALRERHGIYMADNGRINIAGLRHETIAPLIAALAPYLDS